MALITYYVALPFLRADSGEVTAGEPRECQSTANAVRTASFFASDPANCGALALSRSGDPAVGDSDDAIVIRRFGEVDNALA